MQNNPPPVSRRLDYILQALEGIDAHLVELTKLLGDSMKSRHQGQDPSTKLLLPLKEAAAMLGISERTVRVMVQLGDIPTVRTGRRSLRILRTDLDAYIEASRREWGSSRWKGHGKRREHYGEEAIGQSSASEERLPPLDPELRNRGFLFNTMQALRRARITTAEQLRSMTDAELMFVKGIGPTGLGSIRLHFPAP